MFTDGSATDAVTNGGAGILVHSPGGQKATASMAVAKLCSKYRAEREALMQATFIVQVSDHDGKQVVFLSEALSVLQAYQNHKLPNLAKALQQVQLPGGLFCSGFQFTVEYQEMSKRASPKGGCQSRIALQQC